MVLATPGRALLNGQLSARLPISALNLEFFSFSLEVNDWSTSSFSHTILQVPWGKRKRRQSICIFTNIYTCTSLTPFFHGLPRCRKVVGAARCDEALADRLVGSSFQQLRLKFWYHAAHKCMQIVGLLLSKRPQKIAFRRLYWHQFSQVDICLQHSLISTL